jgi:hypothetical protein
VLAIGADWVNSARGFMFAIGCIQSQSCHTNKCPTGVPQDPAPACAGGAGESRAGREFSPQHPACLAEMLAAAGLDHPSELKPKHLARRISPSEISLFSQLHAFLKPGELLSGSIDNPFYARMWRMARGDSFAPQMGKSRVPAAAVARHKQTAPA